VIQSFNVGDSNYSLLSSQLQTLQTINRCIFVGTRGIVSFSPDTSVCLLSNCDVLLGSLAYKNITKLCVGDEIWGYFSKQPEKIKTILKHTHNISTLCMTNKPYLVSKNAFGSNCPEKDIHLSGHHRILLQNPDKHFVGVQAYKLENCKVANTEVDKVEYYHIELVNKGVGLVVNGLAVEDYTA